MNNIFKINSRFAALAEDNKDTDNKSKDNYTDNRGKDNYTDNRSKDNYTDNRSKNTGQGTFENNEDYKKRTILEQARKKEEVEKLEIDKINKMLDDPNSFPDLLGIKKNTSSQINYTSFSEKLKNNLKTETEPEIDKEKEKVLPKPGWTSIIRDPKTGKTSVVSNYIEKKPKVKTDNEYAMAVLTALCDLHEQRTQEHIDRYGYDAWERTFRDPEWDHEYFDRLDEEYEEEMERERKKEMRELEEEEDDEDATDHDKYNYWKH